MSKERFIKLIDCEETDYLQENHPNAFLLLTLIARRARRASGKPDGLEIGEAKIGDYKKAGIETRDKYRTAIQVLVDRSHIKITETCRTRKKCPTPTPTRSTTKGTKVSLCDARIYDINLKDDHHQNPHRHPHRTPTGPPPDPHEQEVKECKEVKEEKEKIKKEKVVALKINFREFVTLTQEEHGKLLALHGQLMLDTMFDILNSYKGSSGKTYKSDYQTMAKGGWVLREANKRENDEATKRHNPIQYNAGIRKPSTEPSKKRFFPRSIESFQGN